MRTLRTLPLLIGMTLGCAQAWSIEGEGGQGGTESEEGGGSDGSGAASPDPSPDPDPTPDPDPGPGNGDDPNTCVYEGEAPIDPTDLPPCPSQCGGHCLDSAFVPDESEGQLADCDASSKCVPDAFIISIGKFIPDTCESLLGAEGRCLSTCIPEVAEQATSSGLPQSTCKEHEVCVPCYSPLDGSDTSACHQSCDPGPAEPPTLLPACCDGIGTCVPKSAAGDQADKLDKDSCPDGQDLVCAPNDLLPGSGFVPDPCTPEFLFVDVDPDHKYGVCLPGCLPDLDSVFLGEGEGCSGPYKCAPCYKPGILGDEESGAPGCVY